MTVGRCLREIHLLEDLGVVPLRVDRHEIEWAVALDERAPIHRRHGTDVIASLDGLHAYRLNANSTCERRNDAT